MKELGIDRAVRDALAQVRTNFQNALPGIKDMRDALMHFDEWLRGTGRSPQQKRIKADEALRDVARDYGSFGYDPIAGTVRSARTQSRSTSLRKLVRHVAGAGDEGAADP